MKKCAKCNENKEEFSNWCKNNKKFINSFNNWVKEEQLMGIFGNIKIK